MPSAISHLSVLHREGRAQRNEYRDALGGKGRTHICTNSNLSNCIKCREPQQKLKMSVSEKEAGVQGKWVTKLFERVLASWCVYPPQCLSCWVTEKVSMP